MTSQLSAEEIEDLAEEDGEIHPVWCHLPVWHAGPCPPVAQSLASDR